MRRREFLSHLGAGSALAFLPAFTRDAFAANTADDALIISDVEILKLSGTHELVPGLNRQYQVNPLHLYEERRPKAFKDPAPGTKEEKRPLTHYYVGIRAYDNCKNYGPLAVIELTTAERETGSVDACFVATAAYGSMLANDVVMLRDARDRLLRSNVAGELLVEAYYTFGPALAGLVGESDELRGVSRDVLDPLVDWMRDLSAWRSTRD